MEPVEYMILKILRVLPCSKVDNLRYLRIFLSFALSNMNYKVEKGLEENSLQLVLNNFSRQLFYRYSVIKKNTSPGWCTSVD